MNDATIFRQQCAAVGNGCPSTLVWEELKARYRPGDELSLFARRLLELNGWRRDHGKWVCGLHGEPA